MVFFSLIESSGKIEWSKAKIPKGRTLKAVMHMFANEKNKLSSGLDEASHDEADGATPVQTPKTPRTAAPKTPKTGSSAKAPAKRKRAAVEGETGHHYNDMVKREHDDSKRMKQELEETAEEIFKLEQAENAEQDEGFERAKQTEQLLQAANSTGEA